MTDVKYLYKEELKPDNGIFSEELVLGERDSALESDKQNKLKTSGNRDTRGGGVGAGEWERESHTSLQQTQVYNYKHTRHLAPGDIIAARCGKHVVPVTTCFISYTNHDKAKSAVLVFRSVCIGASRNVSHLHSVSTGCQLIRHNLHDVSDYTLPTRVSRRLFHWLPQSKWVIQVKFSAHCFIFILSWQLGRPHTGGTFDDDH